MKSNRPRSMAEPTHGNYVMAEVLNADPVKLVCILYRGTIQAVADARKHRHNGDIWERTGQISRAYEMIHELIRALDHKAGGEISRNLRDLYFYMQNRLIEANAEQTDAPLAEVGGLLSTLLDAWQRIPSSHAAVPPAEASGDPEYTPLSCTY